MDKYFTFFKILEEYGFKPRNLKEYLLSSSFNRQNYFKEKIVLFGKKNLNSGTKKVIKKIIKKGV